MEKQALDCNRGVVYRLVAFKAKFITHLTAVSVNTVANAVDKLKFFAVNRANGKVFYVFINANRLVGIGFYFAVKVISATAGIEIYARFDFNVRYVVNESVKSSVASADDNAYVLMRFKKIRIAFNRRHINAFVGI